MNDQILQEIFILFSGRAANAGELSFLNASYEQGGISALVELVNQNMAQLTAQEGEVAALQAIARSGLGIILDTEQASEILSTLRAMDLHTWADIFAFAITSEEAFGQTLNNRAQAANAFLNELRETARQDHYHGEAVESAVTTLIQNIGNSATSLANGIDGLQSLAASLTESGIRGIVTDGYISGATVFADANGDGVWNEGEWKSVTDALGNYDLPADTQGTIIAYGGIDILTGKPFQGELRAPEGASQVTPLTSLLQSMLSNGQASSVAEATAAVQAALGLSENINLLTYDPLAVLNDGTASASDKSIAIAVQSKALQVANLIAQGAAAMGGLDRADEITAALSEAISNAGSGGTLDLGDSSTLSAILGQAASAANSGTTAEQIQQTAQIIAASNTSAGEATDILSLAQSATVAQGAVVEAITAALNQNNLSTVVDQYTGKTLNSAVQQVNPYESSAYFSTLPVIVSASTAASIDENSGANQEVYQVMASHESNLSYSLKPVDDYASFEIDTDTGIVTLLDDPNYEEKDNYNFTVIATDSEGNAAGLSVNLAITDVDEDKPTTTATSATIANTGNAVVQSSEIGTAYLVNSAVTVNNLADITGAADDQWNSVTIATANQDTNLAATGLADGTYQVYAVDAAGNLSDPASNSITLDSTPPSASATAATVANTGNAVVQSSETGTAYLVNSAVTINSLFDITGAADDQWNSVPISTTNQNTNLSATGLADGTYQVYTVDAAGNLSDPANNTVTLDSTPPAASATAATIANTDNAVVQSSETGTAYLVNSAITVNSLTDITGAADDQWNSVTITTANQATNLAATGLADGTYQVYAVDAAGNLSNPASNTITIGSIDSTPPNASVTSATIANTDNAVVQSSETGTAYLVNSAVTVNSLADITGAADDQWNSVPIATANQATNLAATGLADGTYQVYTVDAAGNLSAPANNTVTLDSTPPAASATAATIANTDNAVVQSSETGTAYLVNSAITVNSLTDITGAADDQWNLVPIATANQATNLAATGLADGTYQVYTVDAAGNLSDPASNTITIASGGPIDLTITTSDDADLTTDLSSGTYRLIFDFASNDYSGNDINLTGFGSDDFIAFEKTDGQVQTDSASQSNTQINGTSIYKWHSQRSGTAFSGTAKFDSIGVNVDETGATKFESALLRSFTSRFTAPTPPSPSPSPTPTTTTTTTFPTTPGTVINTLNTLRITGLVGLTADHVSFI